MRIYTKGGDLAFKTFTFPDGQPHFKLETYDREFTEATIEMGIRSPTDLMLALLACDVLRGNGYVCNLDIRYLLGARMDRAIDVYQPNTLHTIGRLINGAGFSRVRILDVHSDAALRLIRNSENVLPFKVVEQVLTTLGECSIVSPDAGAKERVNKLAGPVRHVIECSKKRDIQTGNLSGFMVHSKGVYDKALIVDDICDGGGTFVGLAAELRKLGAKKVYLYVTHGIFSKDLPLQGISEIFTTDSYGNHPGAKVIPISMKDLK